MLDHQSRQIKPQTFNQHKNARADDSEHSIRTLKGAIAIAKKFDGAITLIYVYTVNPFVITTKQVYKYVQAVQELGNNILQDRMSLVEAEGVRVETLLKEGYAVEKLLETVTKQNFNLVLGSRGLSTLKGILMGSVSEGVTNKRPLPSFGCKIASLRCKCLVHVRKLLITC